MLQFSFSFPVHEISLDTNVLLLFTEFGVSLKILLIPVSLNFISVSPMFSCHFLLALNVIFFTRGFPLTKLENNANCIWQELFLHTKYGEGTH
jgi:hypothetical protein